MTAEINSHLREVQEITNNCNFLMVPRIWKPLKAGFLHHIDLIQFFFQYSWSEWKEKLPSQAVNTPSGKNHHLEQRLNDPSFLSAFLQQRKWEGGGEAFDFQESITVVILQSHCKALSGAVANRAFKHSAHCSKRLPCTASSI